MALKSTLTLALALLAVSLPAQSPSPLNSRWTVKLMHRAGGENQASALGSKFWEAVGTNHLEVNYGFARYIEVGAHLGLSKRSVLASPVPPLTVESAFQYFFGANINIHLLPLLARSPDFRFDLYALGRLSDRYQKVFASEPRRHQGVAGAGGGLAFYLTRHIGLSAEYVRSSYTSASLRELHSPWNTYNIGLTYKFH